MKIVHCPGCSHRMTITKLYCSNCDITVSGRFSADRFSFLNKETLDFMEIFILARGNITEIEKRLGISYPTVKTKIEKLVMEIKGLNTIETELKEQEEKEKAEIQKKEKKVNEIFKKK